MPRAIVDMDTSRYPGTERGATNGRNVVRSRMLGVILLAGLLMGAGALPASAGGCPTIGQEWSAWAQLGPDYAYPTGQWTAEAARTGSGLGYPVEEGPGVISRVISLYCE